jgi:hypothetical protein
MQTLEGGRILDYFISKVINQIYIIKKSSIPIFKRYRCMGENGQANFNCVTMFVFHNTILRIRMRT